MVRGGFTTKDKQHRRLALSKYAYSYGKFTGVFDSYNVAMPYGSGFKPEYEILLVDLHESSGIISDGHLWVMDNGALFKFFKPKRKISFFAKARTYHKYDGFLKYELIDIINVKIIDNRGVLTNANLSCTR